MEASAGTSAEPHCLAGLALTCSRSAGRIAWSLRSDGVPMERKNIYSLRVFIVWQAGNRLQISLGSPRINLQQKKGLRREQSHQLWQHRVTGRKVIYGAGIDCLAVLYSHANKNTVLEELCCPEHAGLSILCWMAYLRMRKTWRNLKYE